MYVIKYFNYRKYNSAGDEIAFTRDERRLGETEGWEFECLKFKVKSRRCASDLVSLFV